MCTVLGALLLSADAFQCLVFVVSVLLLLLSLLL